MLKELTKDNKFEESARKMMWAMHDLGETIKPIAPLLKDLKNMSYERYYNRGKGDPLSVKYCPYCKRSDFKNVRGLEIHQSRWCPDLECPICGLYGYPRGCYGCFG